MSKDFTSLGGNPKIDFKDLKMNVILSSGKVGHYYNMALALQKAGFLKKFITTSYFKNLDNNNFLNRFLIKISKRRGYSRFNEEINPNLIKSIFYPEILRRSMKLFPFIADGFSTKVYNYLFDLASCKYIGKGDIFLIASTYGLFSTQKAKKLGATTILDVGSVHPHFYINLLKEEAKRVDIKIKLNYEYYLGKMQKEFEFADFILVPSAFVYKTFLAEGIKASKLRIIPYGANIDQFHLKSKKDNIFRIIFVGAMTIGKGVNYLLKAYKELRLPDSELLLIGRPASHIQPILKQYEGYFKHISMVPHKFINDHYSNSSIFVLPSLIEGSALVVYEAMACGLPVIVTENCGSIARDGKDGFVIPIRDVEALKERIRFFYENEEARIEMGKSARKHIKQYTWERYRNNLINFLKKISEERQL